MIGSFHHLAFVGERLVDGSDLLEEQPIIFAHCGPLIFQGSCLFGLFEQADDLGIFLGLNAHFPVTNAQLPGLFLRTFESDWRRRRPNRPASGMSASGCVIASSGIASSGRAGAISLVSKGAPPSMGMTSPRGGEGLAQVTGEGSGAPGRGARSGEAKPRAQGQGGGEGSGKSAGVGGLRCGGESVLARPPRVRQGRLLREQEPSGNTKTTSNRSMDHIRRSR